MLIGLTGSPRINGVLYADQGAVSGRVVDESIIDDDGPDGLVVVLEQRFRPYGEVVWAGLSEGGALALQSDIGQVCDLGVRTRRDGDPAWGRELTLRVLRQSDVEATSPNDRADHTGRPVWSVRFEWKSLRAYTLAELGLGPVGGYRLVSDDGETAVVEPYGQATHRAERYDVGYRSAQGERATLVLGPDPASATRITPGDVPGTAVIQTTP